MKASQVIRERLEALGFEVLEQPRPNAWWRCWGTRSAGTCCWSVRLRKADKGEHDMLCWFTMAECAKAPVERWDISFGPKYYGSGWPEWSLDIEPEKE
jgi:hypothetical protein